MRTDDGFGQFFSAEVLITGGFGFIGSHLAARLVELGSIVTVIDLDTAADRPSLINLRPGLRGSIHVVRGNIGDPIESVRQVVLSRPFKSIFNCAFFRFGG